MIYLTKISKLKIHFEGDSRTEKILKDALTIDFPGFEFTKAYKEYDWDGQIKLYNKINKTFDHGLIDNVIQALNDEQIRYKKIDFEYENIIDISNLSKELRSHNADGVVNFFTKGGVGIIKFPPRSGKTFMASECIKLVTEQRNFNTLFIVDTQDLLRQAQKDICSYLNLRKDQIGIIQGDNFDLKLITVATIQTLQSILTRKISKKKKQLATDYYASIKRHKERKSKLIQYISTVKFLICDEIHESISSDERIKIVERFDLEYLLGLSATPYKEGEKEIDTLEELRNLKLKGIFGGIIYEVSEQELRDNNILAYERILLLSINHHLSQQEHDLLKLTEPESGNKYLHYANRIIFFNSVRDSILLMVISLLRNLNLKTLVIFSSKQHGYYLEKLTGERFISGDHSIDEREHYQKWFLTGKGKILMASGIYKKGITLPDVEIIFNVDGGKEDSLIIQRKGRGSGITENKTRFLVIDTIDFYGKFFSEHSLNRIKVYEESVGIDNIDVLEFEDIDFYNDLKNYLSEWRSK